MHGLETDMVDPTQTDLHGLAVLQPPVGSSGFNLTPFSSLMPCWATPIYSAIARRMPEYQYAWLLGEVTKYVVNTY